MRVNVSIFNEFRYKELMVKGIQFQGKLCDYK